MVIDSGGYVQRFRINCSIWLDALKRSRDGLSEPVCQGSKV